jgi:hypothetical protein
MYSSLRDACMRKLGLTRQGAEDKRMERKHGHEETSSNEHARRL